MGYTLPAATPMGCGDSHGLPPPCGDSDGLPPPFGDSDGLPLPLDAAPAAREALLCAVSLPTCRRAPYCRVGLSFSAGERGTGDAGDAGESMLGTHGGEGCRGAASGRAIVGGSASVSGPAALSLAMKHASCWCGD